jgi:hypothetical protein
MWHKTYTYIFNQSTVTYIAIHNLPVGTQTIHTGLNLPVGTQTIHTGLNLPVGTETIQTGLNYLYSIYTKKNNQIATSLMDQHL